MRTKLILIGGGGHCKACIDVIEQTGQFEIFGILDQKNFIGQSVLGYPIIGSDEDISKYAALGYHFLITVGQIKSAAVRKKLFSYLESCQAELAIIISPLAYVSKHVSLGKGTIVMHQASINAGAQIGANCILNSGSNVEHDVVIGDHTHISTQAIINGDCEIGDEVFIGSNATVSSQVKIIHNTIIGAGTVVIKSINEMGNYVGNPAKKN